MERVELTLRVNIIRNAFRLKIRRITISGSRESFPWWSLISGVLSGAIGFALKILLGKHP